MAHIQIRSGDGPQNLQVVVDGDDISDHVFIDGFGLVQVGDDPENRQWGLSMIVPVESLDIDLPDAVVRALRASAEQIGGGNV